MGDKSGGLHGAEPRRRRRRKGFSSSRSKKKGLCEKQKGF
jgi:hypothetical protein